MTNPDVLAYVQELREKSASARVATLVELRAFWSDTFYDTTQKMGDRLKSSELLAKSLGAFMTIRSDDGGTGDRMVTGACDGEDVLIFLPDNNRDPGLQRYATEKDIEELQRGNEKRKDAG